MIIWDVSSGKPIYGQPNRDPVNAISFFNKSDDKLISVLTTGVQILTIDKNNKKVNNTIYDPIQIKTLDVNFGNTKRVFTCVAIDQND